MESGARGVGTATRGVGIMAIYMKFTGSKQGWIKGAVTAAKYKDYIEVNSVEFGLGSPFDVHTGQSTGHRVVRPLQITKVLDKSSPLMVQSCDNNETGTVEIVYTEEGAEHKSLVTLSLTNAMVRDFNHVGSFNSSAAERVTLSFTKFEFTWSDGGIVASLDWTQS